MKARHALTLIAANLLAATAAQAQVLLPTACPKAVNVNQACQSQYQAVITTIEGLRDSGAFLSAQADKDAAGIIGKVSSADCKMQQAKPLDALFNLQTVDAEALKLVSAAKPKLTIAGFAAIQEVNSYAIACTQQQ